VITRKMKLEFWKDLFNVVLKYPSTFAKHVNRHNYDRLIKAMQNEPPSQILKNLTTYLRITKTTQINSITAPIDRFVETLAIHPTKKPVLFISHEATRTGAPLIILDVAKQFAEQYDILPIQILCQGGDLEDEFKKIAPAYTLKFWQNDYLLKEEFSYLVKKIKAKFDIQTVYINSVESRQILPYINDAKFEKVNYLVHEMGNYYHKNDWKNINKYSDNVIFPAQMVKTLALGNSKFDEAKISVIGQGLLKPEILKADKNQCRIQIRKELNIEEDAIIILGCGTPIARKGTDIFVLTAISMLNEMKKATKKAIYFIWLGDNTMTEYLTWVDRDVLQSQWSKNIRFIGERKDTIPYFVGSDVFFLTSRGDPFPCVVHESIAAKLPIVAFHNAGGFSEIINGEVGRLVPYGDVLQAKKAINHLLKTTPNSVKRELLNIELEKQQRSYVAGLYALME